MIRPGGRALAANADPACLFLSTWSVHPNEHVRPSAERPRTGRSYGGYRRDFPLCFLSVGIVDRFSRRTAKPTYYRPMTVETIARSDVVTARPTTPIETVAERMREEQVGSVLVVEDDRPVGIVTDRDIGLGIWGRADPSETTAADLMSGDPVTIDPDTEVYEALVTARDAKVRRLPVTEDGELVGIVSLDDVIVLLAGELDEVSNVIQGHAPPY